MLKTAGRVLLYLTEESLIVANCGQPFSYLGLESVCNAHRSSKDEQHHAEDKQFCGEDEAKAALEALRYKRLQSYQATPGDIEEHAGSEESLKREYAGRVLLELLQNAHDAAARETCEIGEKGIGFKGVLNISRERLRIHSGYLHFGFDGQETQAALKSHNLLLDNSTRFPLMRLPFWKPLKEESEYLQRLAKEYTTLVVIPFIQNAPANGVEQLRKDFMRCAEDEETLLLFLPALTEIIWRKGEGDEAHEVRWQKVRESKRNGTYRIEKHTGSTSTTTYWHMLKEDQAAVALRLGKDGMPQPEQEHPYLRAYFITEERSPLPLLMHAHWPLRTSRDHIQKVSSDNRPRYDACIRDLATVVKTALANLPDCATLLDCLKPHKILDTEDDSIQHDLWKAIRKAVLPITPQDTWGLTLNDLRLPPDDIDLQVWTSFKDLLEKYRPDGLNGLPFLPCVETDTRDESLIALIGEENARLDWDTLRDLPLLPVEGKCEPCSPTQTTLFFPPPQKGKKRTESKPLEIPIHMYFLAKGLTETVLAEENLRGFFEDRLQVKPFTLRKIAEEMQSALETDEKLVQKNPRALLNFMQHVYRTSKQKDDCPSKLSWLLRVKVRGGDWQPASEVYAGKDWDVPEVLEYMYEDRHFLEKPKNKNKKHWASFYRWLGIGFLPREVHIVNEDMRSKTKKGLIVDQEDSRSGLPFNLYADPPNGWESYWSEKFSPYSRRTRRIRQNWTLDGCEKALKTPGAFAFIAERWEHYAKFECLGYESSNMQQDYDNDRFSEDSHLHWLFKTIPWVPVKGGKKLYRPKEVFQNGELTRQLRGWVRELDTANIDVGKSSKFLKAIGVRSGWRDLKTADWQGWLEQTGKNHNTPPGKKRKEKIKALLRALLKHSGNNFFESSDDKIGGKWGLWGINRDADNNETWQFFSHREKDSVYYLDRPDLDKIRLNGLWVLPVMLDGLENKAKVQLGMAPLSEHLRGEPADAITKETEAQGLVRRLQGRYPAILAYLKQKYSEDSFSRFPANKDALNAKLAIRVVENLKVQFSLQETDLGMLDTLPAYYQAPQEAKSATLWLERDKCFSLSEKQKWKPSIMGWEWVAKALCYTFCLDISEQSTLKDLLNYPQKELEDKLRDLGVTGDAVREVKKEMQPEQKKETPSVQDELEEMREAEDQEIEPDAEVHSVANPPTNRPKGSQPASPPTQQSGDMDPSPNNRASKKGRAPAPPLRPETRQAAYEAQEWLRTKLQEYLKEQDWQVKTEVPYHLSDGGSSITDIVLTHSTGKEIYIEVKHMQEGRVYWKWNQVRMAKEHQEHYWLAVLTPSDTQLPYPYKITWFFEPLAQLKKFKRSGRWRADELNLDANAQWEPPKRSGKHEFRFSEFVIHLENSHDAGVQGDDFDCLKQVLVDGLS